MPLVEGQFMAIEESIEPRAYTEIIGPVGRLAGSLCSHFLFRKGEKSPGDPTNYSVEFLPFQQRSQGPQPVQGALNLTLEQPNSSSGYLIFF